MAIVTQQTHQIGKSAARQFWDDLMEKYPKVHGVLSILASVFGYVFNGHIVLGAAKWGITVGGRIATSILFFAALWVAGRSTEPASLAHLLNYIPLIHLSAPQVDHMAILSFTLLPEVLLLGAGLTTIEQWVGVKRQGGLYWVWALIYSVLTVMFLGITIYTFTSFLVNGSASVVITASGKADGATLIRALTGWSYALLELLHTGVGARYGSAAENASIVSPLNLQALISQTIEEHVTQLRDDQARLVEELTQQQERRLTQMDLLHQQRLLVAIQEVKNMIPEINSEALTETISTTLEARLREQATISEAKFEALHEAIRLNEARLSEAPGRQQKAKASASPARHEAEAAPSLAKNEASSKVVNLTGAYSSKEALLTEVYRLADEEKLSSYDIAQRVGKPAKTIQRWLRNRETGVNEAAHNAEDEATGTDK